MINGLEFEDTSKHKITKLKEESSKLKEKA
jgi:hypothetical protein